MSYSTDNNVSIRNYYNLIQLLHLNLHADETELQNFKRNLYSYFTLHFDSLRFLFYFKSSVMYQLNVVKYCVVII